MNSAQYYCWNDNVEAIEIEGQWVILQAEQNTITKLNETGGFIWSLLRQGIHVDAIVRRVAREFEVEMKQARTDVDAFLAKLRQVDVIVCGD